MKSTARAEWLQDELNDHVLRARACHIISVDFGCGHPVWRGMGSARLYLALDTPHEDN